jgi:hypothetical protein
LHTNLINGENITLLWKISQDFESLWSPSSLVNCYKISVSQIITNMLLLSWTQSRPSTLFFTCLLISTYVNVSNTTDDTRTWRAYPSGAHALNTVFSLVRVDQSIILFYFIMFFLPLLAYLYFSNCIFWFLLMAFANFVRITKNFVDKPTTERGLLNY